MRDKADNTHPPGMVVTDKWTLVFNPRTGSRSIADVLRNCGFDANHGHPRPHRVEAATRPGTPIIGVIRNPMTWVWSFYYTAKVYPEVRFEDWLDKNHEDVGIYWGRGLNAYRDVITQYWIFERGPLGLLHSLGLRGFKPTSIGYKWKPIAPYWYDGIAEYFPEDCALYDELLYSQEYKK